MSQYVYNVCTNCNGRVTANAQSCPHCGITFAGTPKARRETVRAEAAAEREDRRQYLTIRENEVEKFNAESESFVAYLEGEIIAAGLKRNSAIDPEKLKKQHTFPPFDPGALAKPKVPPNPTDFEPADLTWSQKLLPGTKAKWQTATEAGIAEFAAEMDRHEAYERRRLEKLAEAEAAHKAHVVDLKRKAEREDAELDQFRQELDAMQPQAVAKYFSLVLDRSPYPKGFPKRHKLAFVPESAQLVLEYEFPTLEVVPTTKQKRFVKTKDRMDAVDRPESQIKAIYARIPPQIVLRTLHEIFQADTRGHVETIVFNGFVNTVDRATGNPVSPCLVSVRTTRDTFAAVNLDLVEPLTCLKGLSASVSRSPAELAPVRPIIDFSMVDSRFIDEADVLSELDQRPNLMELSPSEFESLITNLFAKMGLETKLTQASRDGGVDCVAFDARPIFGGKVVIQAKRYKNTVGVAAVRDLYGTVLNEGASKGILVTTSGYGKAAFDFANNKPMELLDGGNLLYLLKEHADMDARIVVPEDWVDPADDA